MKKKIGTVIVGALVTIAAVTGITALWKKFHK
jgi:hypothetical protein